MFAVVTRTSILARDFKTKQEAFNFRGNGFVISQDTKEFRELEMRNKRR